MAFYKQIDPKGAKKTNYANKGSWDDEGTHYRKDTTASQRRFGPAAEVPETGWNQRSAGSRSTYGRPANGRPANGRPANGRPANGRPANAQPASGRPANAQPASGRPANGRPAYGRPANAQPASGRPANAQPASGRPANGRPAYGRPANGRPAYGRPANGRPANGRPVDSRGASAPKPLQEEPKYKQYEFQPQPAPAAPPVSPGIAQDDMINENLLSGRNPIREALKSGRDIEKLLVAKGELSGSAREIVMMAKEARIPVQEVERARLDEITKHHQGMLAFASAYQYAQVEDMLADAKEKGEAPFLVLLDGITDPHNLGAVIRTAECAGAHGVIVPQRRSVGLTPAAVKASAGAVEHVKVARVVNLTRTIEDLQKQGVWFYAATMDGENYEAVDFSGPIGLVIGAEGEGVSRLVQEKCDRMVSLPLKGKIDSLNASVAAGVLMYAVLRSRAK